MELLFIYLIPSLAPGWKSDPMPSRFPVFQSRAAVILCVEIATGSRGKTFESPDTPLRTASYVMLLLFLLISLWP